MGWNCDCKGVSNRKGYAGNKGTICETFKWNHSKSSKNAMPSKFLLIWYQMLLFFMNDLGLSLYL